MPDDVAMYREAKRLFNQAVGLDSQQRGAFARDLAERDPDMAARVETLLAHDTELRSLGIAGASVGGAGWASGGSSAKTSGRASGGPDHVGPYRLLKEIGRGGQGVVYLVDDTRLHRRVALKVLHEHGTVSPEKLARFRREAEAASRLAHPAICTVYDAAVDGHVPYIAMRYVEGDSLAAKIVASQASWTSPDHTSFVRLSEALDARATKPDVVSPGGRRPGTSSLPTRRPSPTPTGSTSADEIIRVVHFIEKVARALHAAHEAGVIHRDMKPGNVMVTPEGEPVIMDFGLAHLEDDQLPTLTRTGEFFGTPAYMSPEHLLAPRVRLDRRTDVWSLGVMLYECVTLQRPFDAPTLEGLFHAIKTREPRDPRNANSAVSRELRVVVATALAKDRNRRYQTALAFAEDLRRVREHVPIAARPAGSIYRFQLWLRRHPLQATPIIAALCVTSYYYWQLRESEDGGIGSEQGSRVLRGVPPRV